YSTGPTKSWKFQARLPSRERQEPVGTNFRPLWRGGLGGGDDGNMKRYHEELYILAREMRKGEGYYRKRDAHDCGRARFGVCHPDNRFGHTPTRQELAADLQLRDQSE